MVAEKLKLPFKVKNPILALGSQSKNTVCFARGNFAYLSPVHADLNNPRDFLNFEKGVRYFLKKNPKIIAHDLHPDYQSTKYALSLNAKRYTLYAIQHHHAHIASCMAENGMKNQKLIAVAFDGTGLGDDGNLWGGDFFICDYSGYQRKAHLRYIPLLGAEKAIWQPWRMACAWLYLIYKDRMFDLGIDFLKKIDKNKWPVIKKMYDSGLNSPLTSSMGRLFDAVASIVLNKTDVQSEAEAAIELEKKAAAFNRAAGSAGLRQAYSFKIKTQHKKYIIEPQPVINDIIAELKKGRPKEMIAFKFHDGLARAVRNTSLLLREETGINQVVLAGGVFQNKVLLSLALDLLYKEDFKVFYPQQLSGNDAGICLGQAAIANFKSRD